MTTDDVTYATILEAVEWARGQGFRVMPGKWGVEETDDNGRPINRWRVYEDCVCPMGAVLAQKQTGMEEGLTCAAADAVDKDMEFVEGFVAGFDGEPVSKVDAWSVDDYRDSVIAGHALGQRFRRELGFEVTNA